MANNLEGIPFISPDAGQDYPRLVKEIVYDTACEFGVLKDHPTFSLDEVYVVWFAYTLGSWKALASTSLPGGWYHEVTYQSGSGEAFVDTYRKTHNKTVRITNGPGGGW